MMSPCSDEWKVMAKLIPHVPSSRTSSLLLQCVKLSAPPKIVPSHISNQHILSHCNKNSDETFCPLFVRQRFVCGGHCVLTLCSVCNSWHSRDAIIYAFAKLDSAKGMQIIGGVGLWTILSARFRSVGRTCQWVNTEDTYFQRIIQLNSSEQI